MEHGTRYVALFGAGTILAMLVVLRVIQRVRARSLPADPVDNAARRLLAVGEVLATFLVGAAVVHHNVRGEVLRDQGASRRNLARPSLRPRPADDRDLVGADVARRSRGTQPEGRVSDLCERSRGAREPDVRPGRCSRRGLGVPRRRARGQHRLGGRHAAEQQYRAAALNIMPLR